MKKFIWALALCLTSASFAQADLLIHGVVDGDLTGGNPKAVMFIAGADIADLSIYGFGSANNGGGTDGEEFTFSGSVSAGDIIVVTGNTTSDDFFANCFTDFTHFTSADAGFTASINGDDAIELFQNGAVIDTYGDIAVIGDGETWDYTDGYAVRTGGVAGAFDQANYNSVFQGLNNLTTEQEHKDIIAPTFGLTVAAIPEPTSALIFGLGGLGLCVVRRR